jgi:hypothetical protein
MPRSLRQVILEYVAREENVHYRREVFVYNDFNRIELTVKAKNVDKHQVLLHSQLYKIRTYNTKRVLQVHFDKCLLNMPNIRLFSIQNLYPGLLQFQIVPMDCCDLSVFKVDEENGSATHESESLSETGVRQHKAAFSRETALDSIHAAASKDFPFNLLSDPMPEQISATEGSMSASQSRQVSAIRQHYKCLRESVALHNGLVPFEKPDLTGQSELSHGVIAVPANAKVTFAVVFEPKSTSEVGSTISNQRDSGGNEVLQRQIHIRILNLTYGDARRHLQVGGDQTPLSLETGRDMTGDKQLSYLQQPLKYRLLLVRAKVYRSVFTVIQRNVNFGRILVGCSEQTFVTIVNKSINICLFSLSKSRSFSSGFLSVSGEARGVLCQNSSRSLDFLFKPTLHGPFDETITIENVLDPENSQSVLFKANVDKPDKFHVKVVGGQNSASSARLHQSLRSIDGSSADNDDIAHAVGLLEAAVKSNVISDDAAGPAYLAPALIGDASSDMPQVTFRLRNISSKKRTFVIDGSHSNVISPVSDLNSFSSADTVPRLQIKLHFKEVITFLVVERV